MLTCWKWGTLVSSIASWSRKYVGSVLKRLKMLCDVFLHGSTHHQTIISHHTQKNLCGQFSRSIMWWELYQFLWCVLGYAYSKRVCKPSKEIWNLVPLLDVLTSCIWLVVSSCIQWLMHVSLLLHGWAMNFSNTPRISYFRRVRCQ